MRLCGETSWKKAQWVQGFWDKTCWTETPSCIHSLRVAGGLINGQVHPLRAVGRQRAWPTPGRAGGDGQVPSSTVLLCPGTLLSCSGQRDQYVQTDGGVKGPPQSQHSWTPSGCGDKLERLRGADGKESRLSEDLELLPECVFLVEGWFL